MTLGQLKRLIEHHEAEGLPSETAREFLEVVGGERCPCGHLTENHHDPEPFELEGFVAVTGKCKICPPSNPCNGQLKFATGFDD